MNAEENTEFAAYLHKLYMKDTHMRLLENKPVPAIAPDFQDILSNLTLTKSRRPGEEHQLEVKIRMNKKAEETAIQVIYSDFRIVVAPPVVAGILEAMNLLSTQVSKASKLMVPEMAKPKVQTVQPNPEPKVIKETPAAIASTRALKFTGEIRNIEVWIPGQVYFLCFLISPY